MKVVFFGSFQHYSVQILEAIHKDPQFELLAVVTTPPQPAGRKQELKQTEVHKYALTHNIPVLNPERLTAESLTELSNFLNTKYQIQYTDLFIVAGYGKLLPPEWLAFPKIAPLNVHFSLLPDYRGAMPGEWAILMGETVTGVTLIEMAPQFDTGKMIAKKSLSIESTDTRESLYTKLYDLGAKLALEAIPVYFEWRDNGSVTSEQSALELFLPPVEQGKSTKPYASLIKKDQTYVPWEMIRSALNGNEMEHNNRTELLAKSPLSFPETLEHAIRAFHGWPGIWTIAPTEKGEKRMKIHSATLENGKLHLKEIQFEGEKPRAFNNGLITQTTRAS